MKNQLFFSLATMLCTSLLFSCTADIEQQPSSSSAVPSSSSSAVSSSSVVVPSSSSSSAQYVGKGNDISDYRTVPIGTQTWMAENLNYAVSGGKCYNNDVANCDKYGMLYNWATAMALPSNCNSNSCSSQINAKHRGICPSGWHIPSDADWNVLMKYVNPSCSDNSHCANAGKFLKATSGWNDYYGQSGNGSDTYSFSALPGGGYSDGNFGYVGSGGYWWSASENDSYNAYYRTMYYDHEYVVYINVSKSFLISVRCLQD